MSFAVSGALANRSLTTIRLARVSGIAHLSLPVNRSGSTKLGKCKTHFLVPYEVVDEEQRFAGFFEIYKISRLLHRSDLKISAKKRPNFCRNESEISFFIRVFSMNFAIFRRNFNENSPEFHRNVQEMTNCLDILRKSARKIRKMLEISGICEKVSFFISSFHSSP